MTLQNDFIELKDHNLWMGINSENEWVILDIEELHTYIKDNNLKDVNLYELINNLEWNITLKK